MKNLFYYRKERPYRLGYVADFCPVEREITKNRIHGVYLAHYLNLLQIAKGDFLRNDRICCSCGVAIRDENQPYRQILPNSPVQLHDLERETNPGVSERYREAIELKTRIGNSTHSLQEQFLNEQLSFLEASLSQHWNGATQLDLFSILFAVFSFLGWLVSFILATKLIPESSPIDVPVVFISLAFGLLIINAIVFFLAPRRAINKNVVPLLAAALSPLNFSSNDLRQALAQKRAEGFRYTTKISTDRLDRSIEAYRNARLSQTSGK